MTAYDPQKDSFESYNVWVASQRAKLLQERCPAARRVEVMESSGTPITIIGDEPRVAVYSITDSRNGIPVYVGTTSQPIKVRVRTHIADMRAGSMLPIHSWMRSQGSGFTVRVLEFVSEEDRVQREKFWISNFNTLLNVTDGGPGMSGHTFAGTDHARRIADKIKTSGYFNCLECGGKFYRKLSQALKGNNKFCCRKCYQSWQRGRSKDNSNGLMGNVGRKAALLKRRAV